MRKVIITSTIAVVAGLVLASWIAGIGRADFTSAAWEDQIDVNGTPVEADPIIVLPGDTVEFVDRVWVTATHDVTFTLSEAWSELLRLEGWSGDTGSIITTAGKLSWHVRDVSPNSWYTITRTFAVQGGDWAYGYVTKTLTVAEGGLQTEGRVVTLARGGVCLPVNITSLEDDGPMELGQTMHFTATVLGSDPIIYTWDYGDGTPLEYDVGLDAVTHTYSAEGTYTATLNVVNGCPSNGKARTAVTVKPPPPEPVWEDQVRVNGVLTVTNPIVVAPGDTVEIADRVWTTAAHAVTFTLAQTWTSPLTLSEWAHDTGSVTTATNTLTWTVTAGAPNAWHTVTGTSTILTGTWDTGAISTSLWVDGAESMSEVRVLQLKRSDPKGSQVALLYLPLVSRSYPAYHHIPDAPEMCPGVAIEIGPHLYREDLDHANDNDWYRFTAQAGVTYNLHTFDLGTRGDTVLYLYGADCATLLAQNDDVEPNDPASRIVWQAPADGEYHVQVRHYDWTVYGADTEYTLRVGR